MRLLGRILTGQGRPRCALCDRPASAETFARNGVRVCQPCVEAAQRHYDKQFDRMLAEIAGGKASDA